MHVIHLPDHRLQHSLLRIAGRVLQAGADVGFGMLAIQIRQLLLLLRIPHHDPAGALSVRTRWRLVGPINELDQQFVGHLSALQTPHGPAVVYGFIQGHALLVTGHHVLLRIKSGPYQACACPYLSAPIREASM